LDKVRDEEANRIAREIHDQLGQLLTGSKMEIRLLERRLARVRDRALRSALAQKAASAVELVDTTIEAVRRISTTLRPVLLTTVGLPAAMEQEARQFEKRTRIRCELSPLPSKLALDQNRDLAVLRIFQEMLTNVARHAGATRVRVSLTTDNGSLALTVRDNGKGITKGQIADPKSLGLLGMRERAYALGGSLLVEGRPGKGSTLSVEIPLPAAEGGS
jgi:signal transduction histidine kinase